MHQNEPRFKKKSEGFNVTGGYVMGAELVMKQL